MKSVAVQDNKVSALGEVTITQDQVALIKNTVATGATDDELKLFFFECRRRGVHPLDRLIHFVKRSGKATFQCGIDFMRSQAEASGQYRGQEDVAYGPIVNGYPEWAKVTVRRIDPNTGDIYTVSATAFWDEFYPGEQMGFMWKKMPRVMLGKVAESQALRKAFPLNFNGLYTFEEMQQSDMVASGSPKTRTPVDRPQEKQPEPIGETLTVNFIPKGVSQTEGVNKTTKKPFKKFIIEGPDGEYNTFSETFAKAGAAAAQEGNIICITYKVSKFGNDIVTVGEAVYESAEG
jgi:phage recombination protein Bet